MRAGANGGDTWTEGEGWKEGDSGTELVGEAESEKERGRARLSEADKVAGFGNARQDNHHCLTHTHT